MQLESGMRSRLEATVRTLPTAASPNSTSFTLLLGFGVESAMVRDCYKAIGLCKKKVVLLRLIAMESRLSAS